MAFLFAIHFFRLLKLVTYLATLTHSGRDPKLGKNVGLKDDPDDDDQQQPTNPHCFFSFPICVSEQGGLPHEIRIGAAHGCKDQAQENPPEGEEQEDALEVPPPDAERLQEKEDISLQVSLSPHAGQRYVRSLSAPSTSCSKTCPHLLHLYS